jgi:2-iminobutanoate/2-iminopropanoate deaminase
MEKKIINPWKWQDERHYIQAVEVKAVQSTLYCAGQAAVHEDGTSSAADMKTQLQLAIKNLEQVISEAGYETKNIVRLNVYTTSHDEFLPHFDLLDREKRNQTSFKFYRSEDALRNAEGGIGSDGGEVG